MKVFGGALQVALDSFFYSNSVPFLSEKKDMLGIEGAKEYYEELTDLGMFQFAVTVDELGKIASVLLLHWTGSFYNVIGTLEQN